ncbi:hypothetical protein FisN_5Lh085 [Fistulifera solaris]|uniref:Uncharacterized protein n=1 Tax=Fistulifera solaris TaxID=1519565 RepID=A0A1Z5JJQ0_FISSO|nr:hypothetical protein FisN_5Lh085 [Fistulifera solaris]|eukprot:GAX14001.1 hypothetical protein FisN_5Lh085 [Fistulifera solaris]
MEGKDNKTLFTMSIILLFWLAFASIRLHLSEQAEERFISSLPHRMLLRPVRGEMNKQALHSLEDAIVNTLTLQQSKEGTQDFYDNEVVIQDIIHLELNSANNSESGSTRVQFVITGVTFLNRTDDQLQGQLGQLLESSLAQHGSLGHFLFLISSDPVLGSASTVLVRPVASNTNNTLDQNESDTLSVPLISTLDIILMCTSGTILLGIVYMLIQHHKDRGYIENQRLVLFNRHHRDASIASTNARNPGANTLENGSHLESIGRISSISGSPFSTAASEHCLSPYRRFLSENYKTKWSQPQRTLSHIRRNITKSAAAFIKADDENDSVDEFVFEDKSDDSVDLFNVDMSSSFIDSKANAASAVTEWMKTIRVVTTDQRVESSPMSGFFATEENRVARAVTVETAISPSVASSLNHSPSSDVSLASSSASSSGFSTGTSSSDGSVLADALSKLNHYSLDQRSLEQSMASSIVASHSKEKMEV